MTQPVQSSLKIIRIREVQRLTGLSRSSIYAKMQFGLRSYDPSFPARIRLTPGVERSGVGWLEHEVFDWIESRVKATRQPF